ncbi:MAG: DUF1957 domain-containing protein [Chloroflexi bacterium]|nr:DUF1957 domain-containing protein [Chloroflexota bacterium]
MAELGAFTFVLHSHLPYCREAGRWPHGEEWLHEAAAETYIPLLNALYDLIAEGIEPKLTLGITPILAEQLADPLVLEHLVEYLQAKIAAADAEIERQHTLKTRRPAEQPGAEQRSPAKALLARWHRDWYTTILRSFQQRYHGDIIGAFRALQDQGMIEIMTSAATHAYLPLASRDSTIFAQIQVAIESYQRHFGRAPRTIWLPECAYRPAYIENGLRKPGVEEFLQAQGVRAFFSETFMIEGGAAHTVHGEAGGIYAGTPRRQLEAWDEPPRRRTTYQPYKVYHSNVAVIGRNRQTGLQVWSASEGYPGEPLYREFHKKDPVSGLTYWRITGTHMSLDQKDWYSPKAAFAKANEHARHFAELVESLLSDYAQQSGGPGYLASVYDTELFGHWWFEGVSWLKQVLRELHWHADLQLMTTSECLSAYPPAEAMPLPEGSWGQGGDHTVWRNEQTEWLWSLIYRAERQMEEIVAAFPTPSADEAYTLNQIARELLLLESSDWPFLITTGQAHEYASQRFKEHLARFNLLILKLNQSDLAEARRQAELFYTRDNPFPTIDYRVFAEREGRAGSRYNTASV